MREHRGAVDYQINENVNKKSNDILDHDSWCDSRSFLNSHFFAAGDGRLCCAGVVVDLVGVVVDGLLFFVGLVEPARFLLCPPAGRLWMRRVMVGGISSPRAHASCHNW